MKKDDHVWIIMPVYNEEASLSHVVDSWLPVFKEVLPNFVFCIINDGSKDSSIDIMNDYASKHPEIRVIDKDNTGHGQSCIYGYQLALENGADWVFQMDSDGQCNPKYFKSVVDATEGRKLVYGFRKTRDDGWKRFFISRIVSTFIWAATGVWVRDANIPYRFMHADTLKGIVDRVPKDFHLANVLISTYQQKHFGIHWVNIHFDDRFGGEPSVKLFKFAKHGVDMFKQLRLSVDKIK